MGIPGGVSVTLYNPLPHCLGNDTVCGKALDDRLGCTALLGVGPRLTPLDIALFWSRRYGKRFSLFADCCSVLRRVRPDGDWY